MFVEFLGLPAAGKTTTVKRLLDDPSIKVKTLRQIKRYPERNIIVLKDFILGIWVLKIHFFRLFNLFITINNTSRLKLLNIVLKIGLINSTKLSYSDEVILCDQLVLQDLWSILVRERSINMKSLDWLLDFYSRIFIGPNLRVIYLDKDLEIVKKQYLNRIDHDDIFKDIPEDALGSEIYRADKIIRSIIFHLPRQYIKSTNNYDQLLAYINES